MIIDFNCKIDSCSEALTLISREEGTKISDFNTWIEKFCSVKESLQVLADKPSQERS